MNYIPKRKKRVRSGIRDDDGPIRCQSHLQWVRGHECCVSKHSPFCALGMHAHHLQSFRAIEGGMGLKVGDDKCVPLCGVHHQQIHDLGQPAFERAHPFIDLEATAADLWKASPHGNRYRLEHPSRCDRHPLGNAQNTNGSET